MKDSHHFTKSLNNLAFLLTKAGIGLGLSTWALGWGARIVGLSDISGNLHNNVTPFLFQVGLSSALGAFATRIAYIVATIDTQQTTNSNISDNDTIMLGGNAHEKAIQTEPKPKERSKKRINNKYTL